MTNKQFFFQKWVVYRVASPQVILLIIRENSALIDDPSKINNIIYKLNSSIWTRAESALHVQVPGIFIDKSLERNQNPNKWIR
jgi:hypothetical protein